ncbi:hypothetical protein [Aquimarina sp. 2201CG5-10]|uniref:hypothetical protein n=1 Tax=Aquimarina callyspongiae TaxID=3098150 RepID=UPI002AB422B1|nr:hypothetical protein [Aquimarina sp. 2201CG5-10]MDY8137439.1 hypothetical protein [Aquimarina sp. 2201CG5-10]
MSNSSNMNAVSVILILLGIITFTVGCLFKIMHWPDMFKGIISGVILFTIGILIRTLKKK